jgi:hypothetical protein
LGRRGAIRARRRGRPRGGAGRAALLVTDTFGGWGRGVDGRNATSAAKRRLRAGTAGPPLQPRSNFEVISQLSELAFTTYDPPASLNVIPGLPGRGEGNLGLRAHVAEF